MPGGTDRIINRFRHDTGDDSDQASISEYFFFPRMNDAISESVCNMLLENSELDFQKTDYIR